MIQLIIRFYAAISNKEMTTVSNGEIQHINKNVEETVKLSLHDPIGLPDFKSNFYSLQASFKYR